MLVLVQPAMAQKKPPFIVGRVFDENDHPLGGVSVTILGRQSGIITSDSGDFRIRVEAEKALALVFSFTGYKPEQRNFLLNEKEEERVTIRMEKGSSTLRPVVVTDQQPGREVGLIKVNPKDAINILVGSNNELTSQYSVRGGNYDENLIYVNDFEVFRPYLVNNAQQEGLSFINPETKKHVSFFNGGFQAKYGDKMSSVLDIQYKKPRSFGGSAYIGLLEQGFYLEG